MGGVLRGFLVIKFKCLFDCHLDLSGTFHLVTLESEWNQMGHSSWNSVQKDNLFQGR